MDYAREFNYTFFDYLSDLVVAIFKLPYQLSTSSQLLVLAALSAFIAISYFMDGPGRRQEEDEDEDPPPVVFHALPPLALPLGAPHALPLGAIQDPLQRSHLSRSDVVRALPVGPDVREVDIRRETHHNDEDPTLNFLTLPVRGSNGTGTRVVQHRAGNSTQTYALNTFMDILSGGHGRNNQHRRINPGTRRPLRAQDYTIHTLIPRTARRRASLRRRKQ
jgi:hypothetical protein